MSNQDITRVSREKKGLSLLDFPKEYILIDLETTGLSPTYNEIIEISALKIKDGEIIDTFSELIKPEYEIDDFIAKLTGITNEMVGNSRNVKEVISDFMSFIKKDDILVGYNVNFDINFLYDNLLRTSNKFLENNFVDIMRIAKYALKDEVDSFRLKKLAKYYEIDTNGMHRGEKDCQVSKIIFEKVQELILDKHQTYEAFLEARKKVQYLNSKDIVSENKEFDLSHQGYNKQFVFTGTLTRLARKDAMQLVVDFGGKVNGGVNKETNFLVMGDLDYSKTVTGEKSSKIIKAETLKLKGQDIEIIPEEVFYDMFEYIENKEKLKKFEPTLYNYVKSFAILLFNEKTKSDALDYFLEHTIDDISIEEKYKILDECFKEELLEFQKSEETLRNYFEKMKLSELKSKLEEKNIEAIGKKSDLVKKLSENSTLEENNLNPIIITTNKGVLLRNKLDYKKAIKGFL